MFRKNLFKISTISLIYSFYNKLILSLEIKLTEIKDFTDFQNYLLRTSMRNSTRIIFSSMFLYFAKITLFSSTSFFKKLFLSLLLKILLSWKAFDVLEHSFVLLEQSYVQFWYILYKTVVALSRFEPIFY